MKTYRSADGTVVYDVNFYVKEEQHTAMWIVALTDEQAEGIRSFLTELAEADLVGWWVCEKRTVRIDDLAELGDRLRSLRPKGRRQRERTDSPDVRGPSEAPEPGSPGGTAAGGPRVPPA